MGLNIQNCQANPLSDVGEIRKVYAGNRNGSTEVVNIWCDSVGKLGIGRKPRWGIFPQNFWSPLAPKLLVRLKKKSRGAK